MIVATERDAHTLTLTLFPHSIAGKLHMSQPGSQADPTCDLWGLRRNVTSTSAAAAALPGPSRRVGIQTIPPNGPHPGLSKKKALIVYSPELREPFLLSLEEVPSSPPPPLPSRHLFVTGLPIGQSLRLRRPCSGPRKGGCTRKAVFFFFLGSAADKVRARRLGRLTVPKSPHRRFFFLYWRPPGPSSLGRSPNSPDPDAAAAAFSCYLPIFIGPVLRFGCRAVAPEITTKGTDSPPSKTFFFLPQFSNTPISGRTKINSSPTNMCF